MVTWHWQHPVYFLFYFFFVWFVFCFALTSNFLLAASTVSPRLSAFSCFAFSCSHLSKSSHSPLNAKRRIAFSRSVCRFCSLNNSRQFRLFDLEVTQTPNKLVILTLASRTTSSYDSLMFFLRWDTDSTSVAEIKMCIQMLKRSKKSKCQIVKFLTDRLLLEEVSVYGWAPFSWPFAFSWYAGHPWQWKVVEPGQGCVCLRSLWRSWLERIRLCQILYAHATNHRWSCSTGKTPGT